MEANNIKTGKKNIRIIHKIQKIMLIVSAIFLLSLFYPDIYYPNLLSFLLIWSVGTLIAFAAFMDKIIYYKYSKIFLLFVLIFSIFCYIQEYILGYKLYAIYVYILLSIDMLLLILIVYTLKK